MEAEKLSSIEELAQELTGHKQVQTNKNWDVTPDTWACPCCKRTKLHILRPSQANTLIGNLINHHDHISTFIKRDLREQIKAAGRSSPSEQEGWFANHKIIPFLSKFNHILICEDCNNADPTAKAMIPDICTYFSFSVEEMACFIEPQEHAAHNINKERMLTVYADAVNAHEYRKSLGKTLISRLVQSSRHWGDREQYPNIKHYKAIKKIQAGTELDVSQIADIFKTEKDDGVALFSKIIKHYEAKSKDTASVTNQEKLNKREKRRRRKVALKQQKIAEGLFNHGEPWNPNDVAALQQDHQNGLDFLELGKKYGRRPNRIKTKLRSLGYDIP